MRIRKWIGYGTVLYVVCAAHLALARADNSQDPGVKVVAPDSTRNECPILEYNRYGSAGRWRIYHDGEKGTPVGYSSGGR